MQAEKLIAFQQSIEGIAIPERFTFPFYYQPHPLSLIAAEELKHYIQNELNINHNFGLDPSLNQLIIGKMFGVLVVQTQEGQLGYLAAYSGKLADSNDHPHFVPPIFDMLKEGGFYREGERKLYQLSDEIIALQHSNELSQLKQAVSDTEQNCQLELKQFKEKVVQSKLVRKELRAQAEELDASEREELLKKLSNESIHEHYLQKDLVKKHREQLAEVKEQLAAFEEHIQTLKKNRRLFSNQLQDQLFDKYHFLDANGKTRSVLSIFNTVENGKPPSGAGECCAPKLLQYAYQHQLKPIALAEFWWGASPASEIRQHENFYPSCRGKCEPILGHMLQGLAVDPNPMLENPAEGREIDIFYEDEDILLVNKPTEFLSVPGKTITDSVLTRIQNYLPNATGPLLVHRLDMSTSGILVVAKNKYAHDYLQFQFIKRIIKKRYVALLDGVLTEKSGIIDLPLRVDLDNRPHQLVCYEHGKPAQTKWELIEVKNGKSLVYFYPITGRTHQLRVHAAHSKGLGMSIVGDDLYGTKSNRLHLHAESIAFRHPRTKEWVEFSVDAEF